MKQIVLTLCLVFFAKYGYSQVLHDNLPLPQSGLQLRYSTLGAKWNKFVLTYYIYNTSAHLTASQRQSIIQQAFQAWANVSPLSFSQTSNPSSADIIIRWTTGSHGDNVNFDGPGGILAHITEPPSSGVFTSCEIHFDDAENWTTGGSGFILLSTAMHEIGHALGLAHTTSSNDIMYAYYTGKTTLSSDDIQGINSLYIVGLSLTSIGGPATTSPGISTYYSPVTYNSGSTYQWLIYPSSGVSTSYGSQGSYILYFSQPGSYTVICRETTAGSIVGEYIQKDIQVVNYAMSYRIASSLSGQIVIIPEAGRNDLLGATKMLTYRLSNMITGTSVATGRLPASGATLDFGHLPAGIYILRIETGIDTFDTHKVVLK